MVKLTRPLILASASPRRAELLTQIDLGFAIRPSHIDELPPAPGEDVIVWAKTMAVDKARATAETIPPSDSSLVLSADTVVVLPVDGSSCGPTLHGQTVQVLGKPINAETATQMLQTLSGKSHIVLSAFALLAVPEGNVQVDVVETEVVFRQLSAWEIDAYVASREPLDKAGGYGIQGRGAVLIERVNGDYFNVVGLPLSRLWECLTLWMQHR